MDISRSAKRSINRLLGIEDGYSNHVLDTGGETMYGITKAVAREYGYKGDMKDLPLSLAHEIYVERYWNECKLDYVAPLGETVAYEILDIAVNCGQEVAGKLFQRVLNAFNKDGDLYEDIEVDGIIGENTINAWEDFHKNRGLKGVNNVRKALDSLQASYYIRLCEKDGRYETFVYGWINKRIN